MALDSVLPKMMFQNGQSKIGLKSSKSEKVLILNSKGGAGKSTFAIALACLYQHHKINTEIIDLDAQGTSSYWGARHQKIPIQQYNFNRNKLFSLAVKVKFETQLVIIDTPSNFSSSELEHYLTLADKIIIPLQPSPIDIHAVLNFMRTLISCWPYQRRHIPIAFVATRSINQNEHYPFFQKVLNHLQYPVLGCMTNDSCYQKAFENGCSFLDLNPEIDQSLWSSIQNWIVIDEK